MSDWAITGWWLVPWVIISVLACYGWSCFCDLIFDLRGSDKRLGLEMRVSGKPEVTIETMRSSGETLYRVCVGGRMIATWETHQEEDAHEHYEVVSQAIQTVPKRFWRERDQ